MQGELGVQPRGWWAPGAPRSEGGGWKTAGVCSDRGQRAAGKGSRHLGNIPMTRRLFPKFPWKEEYVRFTLAHLICI